MTYDFAPRLAARARARHRRHILFTVCLLALPALSFQTVRGAADAPPQAAAQLAHASR